MKEQEAIKERYARVAGALDERSRRAVAASEALALGWGGITAVSRATGLSRTAIWLGIKQLRGELPRAAPYDDRPLFRAFEERAVPEPETICRIFFGGRQAGI